MARWSLGRSQACNHPLSRPGSGDAEIGLATMSGKRGDNVLCAKKLCLSATRV